MQIVLIRHGKTKGNLESRYIGARTEEGLIETLEDVAPALLDSYKALRPQQVYVSPMQRCRQTAQLLYPQMKQVIVEELKEMDFGLFEGKNYEELKDEPAYGEWLASCGSRAIPGGEDKETFQKRCLGGFDRLRHMAKEEKDWEKKPVVCVCHGGSIMAILSGLTGEDYYSFQVKNWEGYAMEVEEKEGELYVLSYHRLTGGLSS